MTLPALKSEGGARAPLRVVPAQDSPEDPDDGAPGSSPRKRLVLVAEDEGELRETLREIFSLEGHEVLEAADGEQALQVLRSHDVEVLLLDLHMPRQGGLSLLDEIDPPPPVVVIYSAFEFYSQADVQRRVGAKVFRFLRKPVPPSQLVASVADALAELDAMGGGSAD
jgi:CheY-like chemotaxis protein